MCQRLLPRPKTSSGRRGSVKKGKGQGAPSIKAPTNPELGLLEKLKHHSPNKSASKKRHREHEADSPRVPSLVTSNLRFGPYTPWYHMIEYIAHFSWLDLIEAPTAATSALSSDDATPEKSGKKARAQSPTYWRQLERTHVVVGRVIPWHVLHVHTYTEICWYL